MTRFRQNRFWFRMLLSYLVITLLCLTLYCAFIIASAWNIGRSAYDLDVQTKLDNVREIITECNNTASEIISRINYSTDFTGVSLALAMGQEISIEDRTEASNALISSYVRSVYRGVDEIALFLDGQSLALAATGYTTLPSAFQHMSFPTTYVTVDSLASLLEVDSRKVTFANENLLYVTSFRYTGGLERGVIAISFSLDSLSYQLLSALGEGSFTLLYNGREIYSAGQSGEGCIMHEVRNTSLPNLVVQVSLPAFSFRSTLSFANLGLPMLVGLFFYIFLIALSIFFSLRYYRPLKVINAMVPKAPGKVGEDEVEAMIENLKDVVEGYDEYTSGIDRVAPLVEQGMLHDLVTGDGSRLDSAYLRGRFGFLKAFYFIIAVNIESPQSEDLVNFPDQLDRIKVALKGEDIVLNWYRRDGHNYFININTDEDGGQDALVERIHAFLDGALAEGSQLTFGVDLVRSELADFTEACNGALGALEYMLVRGKGEVYFAEDVDSGRAGYFFPANYELVLVKAIRLGEDPTALLASLLKSNLMKHNLDAKAVRELSAELYFCLGKCASSLGVDYSVQKADSWSTVEEVFDFFSLQLAAIAQSYHSSAKSADDARDAIARFVDENFTLPSLSLALLAEKFHVSTRSITNYYYRRYGVTYLKYVTRLRMERAKSLLETTDEPIDSIALASGYTSPLSFRRNFKEETGMTPSQWRLEKGK